jgi:hypothetical protein
MECKAARGVIHHIHLTGVEAGFERLFHTVVNTWDQV